MDNMVVAMWYGLKE